MPETKVKKSKLSGVGTSVALMECRSGDRWLATTAEQKQFSFEGIEFGLGQMEQNVGCKKRGSKNRNYTTLRRRLLRWNVGRSNQMIDGWQRRRNRARVVMEKRFSVAGIEFCRDPVVQNWRVQHQFC
jgi:hypothetical protein